jgi:hypothetical protein
MLGLGLNRPSIRRISDAPSVGRRNPKDSIYVTDAYRESSRAKCCLFVHTELAKSAVDRITISGEIIGHSSFSYLPRSRESAKVADVGFPETVEFGDRNIAVSVQQENVEITRDHGSNEHGNRCSHGTILW